jgi:hypothetical protein
MIGYRFKERVLGCRGRAAAMMVVRFKGNLEGFGGTVSAGSRVHDRGWSVLGVPKSQTFLAVAGEDLR